MAAAKWVYLAVAGIVWVPAGAILGWAFKPAAASAQFEQPSPTAIPERAFPGMRVSYSGSGTFQVPAQVTPGQYIVTASGLTFGCSWELRKADDGKPKSVTDAGAVSRGETGQFTVRGSDRVLKLLGDCMWRQP